MHISQNLIINTFFQYCKRPVFKKTTGTYTGECPYCHEGKSAGKKRRFFYIPEEDHLYCHNCNISLNGLDFVKEQTGLSLKELLSESELHTDTVEDIIKRTSIYKKYNPKSLPDDCINLFDNNQTSFYSANIVVRDALLFLKKRRIDTAINRPRAVWLSLTDYTHRNRVIFPFYSPSGGCKIEFYQSRALYREDEEKAKYLSKANSDKGIFNIDKIVPEIDFIFLQEGPVDAMFLRNSIALAGINPTTAQLERVQTLFPMHTLVYVLDNQWVDNTSYEFTRDLLNKGQSVFLWPSGLERFKDINDLCVHTKQDELDWNIVVKHTYTGMKGLLKFSQIKCKQH